MRAAKSKSYRRSERGLITLDFIFAMFFAFGFCALFFALSVMLSYVEITQYITFATSRAYHGAHQDPEQQIQLGKDKYSELMNTKTFKALYGLGWVKLGEEPELGDFNDDYPQDYEDSGVFVGARVSFDARLLHLSLPFLGPTASDTNIGKATLNSYLMREVTTQECRENFNVQRFQAIMSIYNEIPTDAAKLITDNGC